MALALRHPFADLFDFQDEVSRLFAGNPLRLIRDGENVARAFVPPVDIEVSDAEIRFTADLPGVEKDQIEVSVDGGVLSIRAKRNAESSTEQDGYVRRERSYGEYSRSFQLPDVADLDSLKAAYKDGVLTVTLAKKKEAQPRQIKVE